MFRQKNNNVLGRCAMLVALLFTLTATTVPIIRATTEDCILPKVGPWPPCATDGDTPPPVPADCDIPDSGPWPPCATAGDPPPINTDTGCAIPPSGPWPPCATGAGGDPPLTPAPNDPPDPNQEWLPNSIIVDIDHTDDSQLAMGDYVRFLGDLTSPSAPIRLEWHISNASNVTFSYTPTNYGSGGFYTEGMGSGNLIVSHDPMQGGTDAMYMISTDSGISTALALPLPCEYQWNPIFVANPNHPAACPVYEMHTRAFQQNFERGMMIWLQSNSNDLPHTVLVVDKSGTFHREVIDTYIRGIDPIKDMTITPPEGMYQPEYSVGKVWRDNPDIREKLGWGVDFGQFYSAHQQGVLNNRYHGLDYISLNESGFIGRHYPQPWIVQSE